MYKDLTVKIKFIYIFSGKFLLLAQLCEIIVPLRLRTNLGGPRLREGRNYNKYLCLHNKGTPLWVPLLFARSVLPIDGRAVLFRYCPIRRIGFGDVTEVGFVDEKEGLGRCEDTLQVR